MTLDTRQWRDIPARVLLINLREGEEPKIDAHELVRETTNSRSTPVSTASSHSILMAGQLHISSASTPGAVPQVKGGKLKALAVASSKRIGQLPEVPTVSESELPGYEANVWYGVAAPARTPEPIVNRLNSEMARIIGERAHRERMIAGDFEPTFNHGRAIRRIYQEQDRKNGLKL